jgi:hypothetical protein
VLERFAEHLLKSTIVLLSLLMVSIIIVYYPSLSVPFYLDDRDSIVTNLVIQSGSLDMLMQSDFRPRIMGYFSLWANYQVGGLDPIGYHMVNIAIHGINSLLVFFLSLQLMRYFAPSDNNVVRSQQTLWALAVAAIWALHPLNTQAVTYVVQRLASIVTLFYLAALMTYIKLRQQPFGYHQLGYGLILIGLVIGGLHAKQNFANVLVFFFCWELMTSTPKIRRYLLLLTVAVVFSLAIVSPFIATFWQALDTLTRDSYASSRGDYFYTQMIVLWDYVGRFIYPMSSQLNIDTELKTSLTPLVALAFVGHTLLIGIAYRYRKKLPLLLTGVVLFYTSHIVESSFIPIKDLAFEHRTYIGNIGLTLSLIALLQFWLIRGANDPGSEQSKERSNKISGWVVIAVLCVLCILSNISFKRNMLWQDPLDFYANEVHLAPEQARANASYGTELMRLKRFDQAEVYLKKSFEINLAKQKVTASGLTAYMALLYQQKQYQKAAAVGMIGLKYIKANNDRSELLAKLGYGYIQMGYCDFAKGLLNNSLKLNPNNTEAKTSLEYCLAQLGVGK